MRNRKLINEKKLHYTRMAVLRSLISPRKRKEKKEKKIFTTWGTVEPRFNEPLFEEVLNITNDILRLGQSYSKMHGIEPRYDETRCKEFFDITMVIRKP